MKTITLLLRGIVVTMCVVFTNSLIMSLYHFEYPYWQDVIEINSTFERYLFFYLTLGLFAVMNAITIVFAFKAYEHLSDTIKGVFTHADKTRRPPSRQEDPHDI